MNGMSKVVRSVIDSKRRREEELPDGRGFTAEMESEIVRDGGRRRRRKKRERRRFCLRG